MPRFRFRLYTLMILVAVVAVGLYVVMRLVVGTTRTEAIALASAYVRARDPNFQGEDHVPTADLAVYVVVYGWKEQFQFPVRRYYWLVEFQKGGIVTHFVTVDRFTGRCGEWNGDAELAE